MLNQENPAYFKMLLKMHILAKIYLNIQDSQRSGKFSRFSIVPLIKYRSYKFAQCGVQKMGNFQKWLCAEEMREVD